jgi:hypothetical protein
MSHQLMRTASHVMSKGGEVWFRMFAPSGSPRIPARDHESKVTDPTLHDAHMAAVEYELG